MAKYTQGSDRGARLRSVFILSHLNRNDLAEKYDISIHTLHAWMCGARTLSEKGAKKVCHAFKQNGWFCSPEWLLTGKGIAPVRIEDLENADSQHHWHAVNVSKYLTEDFAIAKEIAFFKMAHPQAEILMIGDDAMAPNFMAGDHVAGTVIKPEQYNKVLGRPCIVEIASMERSLRILHRGSTDFLFNLSATNLTTHAANPVVTDCTPLRVAPVIWARMSLSNLMQ